MKYPFQSNLSDTWKLLFNRKETSYNLSAGLYHYEIHTPSEKSKVHLRIEPDGSGILFINAARVLHLNQTASTMAWLYLSGESKQNSIEFLYKRFQTRKSQVIDDYTNFTNDLDELIRSDGACPIHELDLEVIPPFDSMPSAPYRMDLALTYRCNNDCSHCYNARPRTFPEKPVEQWKIILDKLWEVGIPHVVFTGGEPTLYDDLPVLIAHAQHNGQITGINTNGRRLSSQNYLNQLIQAGLDHVQITLESHLPNIHDQMVQAKGAHHQTVRGLENALDSSLYVMTNTTLLKDNSPYLEETLKFLAELGVPTVGVNALIYSGHGTSVGTGLSEKDLPPLLEMARNITEANSQKLIWYTPTQYCNFDPMQLELGIKSCTAARYNMCVEPDGTVLPCQSYYTPVGNLLQDSWTTIWNHPLCLSLRSRQYIPTKCSGCVLLQECGGGCPLSINQHDHV
jgi:radical SAM protein with 4Fe4S-binding SPASM domain